MIAVANPLERKVLRQFLSFENFKFEEIENESGVLERIRAVKPTVIIIDEPILASRGRQFLELIQVEKIAPKGIIILRMGENKETDSCFEALHEPFTLLYKPLDGSKLKEAVKKALGTHVSREESLESIWDTSKFSDEHFALFQEFLMRKVGLFFDIKRKADLGRALNRRMKTLNISSYTDYYEHLNSFGYEEKELKNLILHLTIGETTFFRSPDQFIALRKYILPKLVEVRRTLGIPHLRIWSAGCSTGEEPYSIAITLKESIPDFDRWDIAIYATDINNKFLKFAERGVYPSRKIRFISQDILSKYFRKEDENWVIDESLKKYIKFQYHNLSADSYLPFHSVDIIFCRNVLIYFKRERIKEVIDRFRDALSESGYLMLGYSETLFQISDDFKSIHFGDAFFYQKLTEKERREAEAQRNALEGYVRDFVNARIALSPTAVPPIPVVPQATPTLDSTVTYIKSPSPNVLLPPPARESIKELPKRTELKSGKIPELKEKPILKTAKPTEKASPEELALWEEGMNHYFNERFDMAEKVFRDIADNYPNSARAALGFAFIYANKGQDELASQMIKQALAIEDLLPEAYFLRALLSEKDGDIEGAVRDYRNVILLDADFVMAHFNLAIIYMKQGLMKDSRRELKNTLEILKKFDTEKQVKFSGGLHREALIQLCRDLSE